ncbi:uncharacterized protein BDV17DRAFT_7274 [Aspergillus undulatus]|uniref:uncharacterized protein n=1 Tax=Aspergillus undulatus TaxID=1810928 RepID=UPI003CCC959C
MQIQRSCTRTAGWLRLHVETSVASPASDVAHDNNAVICPGLISNLIQRTLNIFIRQVESTWHRSADIHNPYLAQSRLYYRHSHSLPSPVPGVVPGCNRLGVENAENNPCSCITSHQLTRHVRAPERSLLRSLRFDWRPVPDQGRQPGTCLSVSDAQATRNDWSRASTELRKRPCVCQCSGAVPFGCRAGNPPALLDQFELREMFRAHLGAALVISRGHAGSV